MVLVVFSATALFVSAGEKANKQQEKKDSLRALYKDKARFEKLSGTAKMRLHRKFGKRQKVASGALGPVRQNENQRLSPADIVPNVLVNDPTADATVQDTQSTTSIVLAGPNIVVAFTDSGSLNPPTAEHFTGYAHSSNGGTSFTDNGGLPNDPSGEGDDGDPVLDRNNTTGRVYLSTGGFDTGEVLQVFRSNDNGQTFGAPVQVGFTAIGDLQDKQWLTVDNFPGSGQGNVYIAWRSFGDGIYFSRSIDHGDNWSAPLKLADEGTGNVQGANVVVGTDHSVHVFWLDQSAGAGTANIVRTRKSTDQGVSFASAVTVATLMTTGTNGNLNLDSGFDTNSFPHAAVNPVLGDIYVTWNDDVAGADNSDVFMSWSSDGGATWAAATNISNIFDSSTNDDYMPTLAVTPDGTKVLLAWYDRELDPKNLLIDRFGAIANATAGSLGFTFQFRISDVSWPPAFSQDPQMEIQYMGDYDQAVADNSFFYTVWGDSRLGNLIHPNQPDVRFAKISVNGPGGILVSLNSTIDDSGGNNNGLVDFNECINLNLTLKNLGTATVTGISATLTTSTSDVTIVSGTSNYPNLAPGASASNSTTFQFTTASAFACGSNIDFVLQVNTANAGTYVFSFTIQSGADGSASQFDNNTSTPLPDATTTGPTTTDIPIAVSGFTGNIGKVTLSVYLTHTYDGDLDISLIAPNGTEVALSNNNGGDGEDFGTSCTPESNRTRFDDTAATFIEDGTPPYVGMFRPEGSLSDFNGLTGTDVNGVWTLRIKDEALIDLGTFNCASLFLTAAICTDGGGTVCITACIYENTFNDGVLEFLEEKPTVTEVSGFLVLTPAGKKAIALSPPAFAGCQNCTITAEIKFSGGTGAKGWMYTHRVDKKNQLEVLFKQETGRIVIKQRVNGKVVKKAKVIFTLAPNTIYSVKLQYNGTIVTLTIDGVPVLTFTPVGTIPFGIMGFASKLNMTSVDRVCAQ